MSSNEIEWIKSRVDGLTDRSEEILDVDSEVRNEFNTWSALKLIIHSATVNMYTMVAKEHFQDFFYIDALAGSGASDFDMTDQCFLGSPIVAARDAVEPFTKMYFIELDEANNSALEDRLDYAFTNWDIDEPEGYEVIEGDANEAIEYVKNDIWSTVRSKPYDPKFNSLLFADNQGLDFYWSSLQSLNNSITGDFLINYPASQVGRNLSNRGSREAIADFFGRDMWDVYPKDWDHFSELYTEQIEEMDHPETVVTKVKGKKSFYYDMIYATRRTSGGSGYIDAIKHVKQFVEAVDGADVREVLEVLNGNQSVIEDFWPEDNTINEDLIEDEDSNQKGLDEFW